MCVLSLPENGFNRMHTKGERHQELPQCFPIPRLRGSQHLLAHFTPLSLCARQGTHVLLLVLNSHQTRISTEGLTDKELQSIQFQVSSPGDPCSSASLKCTPTSTGNLPSHSSPQTFPAMTESFHLQPLLLPRLTFPDTS